MWQPSGKPRLTSGGANMPYVTKEARAQVDQFIDELLREPLVHHAGVLNYVISRLVRGYRASAVRPSYDSICEVTGVLENVKSEFYRRVAAEYEDRKKLENGDL